MKKLSNLLKKCAIYLSIFTLSYLNIQAQTLQTKINQLGPTISDYNDLLDAVNTNKITIKEIYDSGNNKLCVMANKFSLNYDTDKDTLCDFYEIFKYGTDPNNADSDGDGILDSDWNEKSEYVDTISYRAKIMNVYNLDAMNNAFQDYRIIEQTDTYTIFDILNYPNNKCYTKVYQSPDWKTQYAQEMQEYLEPTAVCNWDKEMQDDLIRDISKAKIYPNKLTDLELVRKATRWIESNNKMLAVNGQDIFMEFDENNKVIAPTRKVLTDQFEDFFKTKDYEQIKKSTIMGKEMFYNRTMGACLSSSTYYATVLRALGIPCRIVTMTNTINPQAKEELELLDSLDKELKTDIMNKLPKSGWTNHYHLQCYIGNLWVDIDYTRVPYNFLEYPVNITFNHFKDYSEFAPIANEKWFKNIYDIEITKGFKDMHPYELIDIKSTKAKY